MDFVAVKTTEADFVSARVGVNTEDVKGQDKPIRWPESGSLVIAP